MVPPLQKSSVLTSAERIAEEMVIGIFPHSEMQTTAALEIASKESLLRGTSLTIKKPGGKQIVKGALVRQLEQELCTFLGGWFCNDLTSYVGFYDDLIPQSHREQYHKSGVVIPEGKSNEAFYYLVFSVPPWQVQAVGNAGIFHAIFLGRLLSQSQALGKGDHPKVRPIGTIESVLAEAAPNFDLKRLADTTSEHAANVFDTYLVDKGSVVKAGVRMRLEEGGKAFQGEKSYFYGIRINIDLKYVA